MAGTMEVCVAGICIAWSIDREVARRKNSVLVSG